jgi:hypothetical protein
LPPRFLIESPLEPPFRRTLARLKPIVSSHYRLAATAFNSYREHRSVDTPGVNDIRRDSPDRTPELKCSNRVERPPPTNLRQHRAGSTKIAGQRPTSIERRHMNIEPALHESPHKHEKLRRQAVAPE